MKSKTLQRLVLVSVFILLFVATTVSGPLLAAGLTEPIFEAPALITTIGQSADGQMVRVLAQRINLNFQYETLANADMVSNFKTLVLVVGGSSKGLGAAGINPEREEARAKALIEAAKGAGTKILFMHVGGEARRGDLTDRFVTLTAAAANYLIVVADGNKDGFMTNAAGQTPIDLPETIGDAGRLMKAAFK